MTIRTNDLSHCARKAIAGDMNIYHDGFVVGRFVLDGEFVILAFNRELLGDVRLELAKKFRAEKEES